MIKKYKCLETDQYQSHNDKSICDIKASNP